MTEPILILALPRSGSSMVAGLFAKHGVWVGAHKTSSRNAKGSFEGEAIRNIMLWAYGRTAVKSGRPVAPREGLRARIESAIRTAGYVSGPWLWKGSVMYYPAWHEFKPKVVVCRRDPEASFRSATQPPYVYSSASSAEIRETISAHNAEIDRLVAAGAYAVDTQAVVRGDYATLRTAIEGCGLAFDEELVREFVDPTMWHHTA